jgi:hypothetical protein
MARERGHELVGEYIDHESGRKGVTRKRFDALFTDGEIDPDRQVDAGSGKRNP